ncbi:hypothetical protein ISJ10_23190 [Burkholderia pseudomallei]|uniref:hypothetical protein n=1 Tax=Burkholderia pseudomallei TaxID=28450 RepID=UPI00048C604C|nr:hypothetical protein [Burkholderia pseudomallei]AYE27977.1 hypothetical protein CNX72_11910 [Burkholderia pseudomallei]MBF3713325.1 hypothetical protein [Burkholderia pseudomallei]MBF3719433.1 hypothetical protein [Burkholderia pseudomallei]MBF3781832.1 hypothetical protein [Burkholderia pseudomallei]MBF4062959.1 hypothetical protein [Burkholderia pseudomallei]
MNRRLDFIRQLYASSSAPFVDCRTKIENKEEPFVPPYSEDLEPAFMLEWQEASDSIDVLGHACLCMLSSALQAYLHTRHKLHCRDLTEEEHTRGSGCIEHSALASTASRPTTTRFVRHAL